MKNHVQCDQHNVVFHIFIRKQVAMLLYIHRRRVIGKERRIEGQNRLHNGKVDPRRHLQHFGQVYTVARGSKDANTYANREFDVARDGIGAVQLGNFVAAFDANWPLLFHFCFRHRL